ncbi:hypothetical protein [Methylobacterium aquaticum]|uniref:hypothetical protein n=1 Tax=Methylobacterium aquaticum TaxID=270351 RepID=UPI0011AE8780|nr:hypothetical protein [Methylobacterium aquaticum]
MLKFVDPEDWPRPAGWTAVGLVGRLALAYDPERRPYLIGAGEPRPLDPAAVNAALYPAIEAAALRLWPGGWAVPLSDVFGIDRRAVTPSRITKKGLHPQVLRALGSLAEGDDADSRGYLLVALARYVDRYSWPRQGLECSIEDVRRDVDACMASLLDARRRGPVFPSRRTEADED